MKTKISICCAAVRAVVFSANNLGIEVVGVLRGYEGLIDWETIPLGLDDVRNINNQGGTILFTSRSERFLDQKYRHTAAKNLRAHDVDAVVAIGGDGTLIRAATRVETLEIPLMGVNLGTLGYLCEVEEATVFDAIDSLMADKYMTEDRIMLTGHKRGSETSRVALNDIVIHRKGNLQILSLNVYVNGEFLNNYHADGIIVATPTGSTGYSKSEAKRS